MSTEREISADEATAALGQAIQKRLSMSVDLENQRRQLQTLGLLGEFAPSCDIVDALGEALLRARAQTGAATPQQPTDLRYLLENLRGMCAFTEPYGRCEQARELRDFCTPCRAAVEIERLQAQSAPTPTEGALDLEPFKALVSDCYRIGTSRGGVPWSKVGDDIQALIAEVERLREPHGAAQG